MESIDSPKYRGESLVASWRRSNPLIGLTAGDWNNADIRGQQCKGFRAIYRNLQHFAAPDCDMPDALFAHCNLSHSDFQRSTLTRSSWVSSHLEQARLNAARLTFSQFDHANLRSAGFQRSQIQQSSFRWANLQHANFDHADVRWCDFRAANLQLAKWNGTSKMGCIINQQTKEQSQWRDETVEQWLDEGAVWSEEMVHGTRFSPGVDLTSTHHSSFDVADALVTICQSIGLVAIAGAPPHLFIATLNVDPTELVHLLQQVASNTEPSDASLAHKWTPVHQWLRRGAQLSTWIDVDGQIQFNGTIQF